MRAGAWKLVAHAVQVDVVGVGVDEPGEAARVGEVGGAVVGEALVDETVVLGDPPDRLVAVAGTPNVALAFLVVEGFDEAWLENAAVLLKRYGRFKVSGTGRVVKFAEDDKGCLLVAWNGTYS